MYFLGTQKYEARQMIAVIEATTNAGKLTAVRLVSKGISIYIASR